MNLTYVALNLTYDTLNLTYVALNLTHDTFNLTYIALNLTYDTFFNLTYDTLNLTYKTPNLTYDKVGTSGQVLTQLQLPQTELCPPVVVRGLVPHPPPHVHHLKLVPPGLAVPLQTGIRPLHPRVTFMFSVYDRSVNTCYVHV